MTIVIAGDVPLVSRPCLQHLAMNVAGRDVAVTAPVAAAAPDDRMRLRIVEPGPDELARFDPDDLMMSTVNTPHDYRQACSRALNR